MKKALLILAFSVMILVGILAYDFTYNDGRLIFSMLGEEEMVSEPVVESQPEVIPTPTSVPEKTNTASPTMTAFEEVPTIEKVEVDEEGDDAEAGMQEAESEEVKVAVRPSQKGKQGGYYYNYLQTDEEKECYQIMVDTITNLGNGNIIPTLKEDRLNAVYLAVQRDHPEIFYIDTMSYRQATKGGIVLKTMLDIVYEDTKGTIESTRQRLEAESNNMLSGISMDASDYEKVKYVYETIIKTTDYNLNAPNNQEITSVILNHESVCAGYTRTMQYLLNKLGVEAVFVEGKDLRENEDHAWNLVKIDGQYYYVDCTWGDTSKENANELGRDVGVNYAYLNVTTEEILRNHAISADIVMPECTSKDANYFVREGKYLTEYDENVIKDFFDKAYEAGEATVCFKCSSLEVHDEVKKQLITYEKVFDMLRDTGAVSYSDDSDQRTLCFWL